MEDCMNLQTRGREGDPKQQKNWRAYLMDGILHEHINRESLLGKIHFQIQNNKQPTYSEDLSTKCQEK